MSKGRRRIGALCVAMLLIAFGAMAAQAQAFEWNVTGKILGPGETREITCQQEGPVKLISSIGTTPVEIQFGKAECVTWKIWNSEGDAHSSGKLSLKEAKVLAPATCAVETGAVTTNTLKGLAKTYSGLTSKTGILYEPETGTTLAAFKLVKGTGACAIAGTYSLTGKDAAEVNEEGKLLEVQPYKFSEAIQKATGTEPKLGPKNAVIAGTINFIF